MEDSDETTATIRVYCVCTSLDRIRVQALLSMCVAHVLVITCIHVRGIIPSTCIRGRDMIWEVYGVGVCT